jgi:NAD(P)-dependent dehydrogenase (short-subunit alcohol dehydrogenase family)
MISGRSGDSVEAALGRLRQHGDVAGGVCEVTDAAAVQRLWDTTLGLWGRVDYWLNNAGVAAARDPLDVAAPEVIANIVATNLTGALLGARVAIAGMRAQGAGQVVFMEGFGSNDMTMPGMTTYGASKRAIVYVAKSLRREVKGTGIGVVTLSPGMVATDMLREQIAALPQVKRERTRKILNILADPVEPVTAFLARRLLANRRSAAHIRWVSRVGLFVRFLRPAYHRRTLFGAGES